MTDFLMKLLQRVCAVFYDIVFWPTYLICLLYYNIAGGLRCGRNSADLDWAGWKE